MTIDRGRVTHAAVNGIPLVITTHKLPTQTEVDLEEILMVFLDELGQEELKDLLAYCLRELLSHPPAEIGVAVLHCKDKRKNDEFPPAVKRYWVGQHLPDIWVVYPWDAEDIDQHEACIKASL